MKNAAFRKTRGNMTEKRDTNPATTEARSNYLVSEPNHDIAIFFSEDLIDMDMKKKQIFTNKSVYLGPSMVKLNKVVMHEFWYDYVKPKYTEKAKLCSMDTGSFIVYIKTEDKYVGIAKDVETRFDISNYKLDVSLSKAKKKKKRNRINEVEE